ncbi:putative RNA-directed DNA polymerase from transposon BS [Frankliniella fusca]|uniref:RNA-directed DNA polymerase from transposon BS n=2 Tax=Frankliniella fusca TaxID=407009 RepID=A0AAE1HED6_9NEOP|nr:putative RNA-directed DNA polymerase from transposon BS [Frankliniella fusca]
MSNEKDYCLYNYVSNIANRFPNKLKIIHLNAQSLNDVSHQSEFLTTFNKSNIDIITVSETWFRDNDNLDLPGVYRRPKAGYLNYLLDDIYKFSVDYKYFFLTGDINAGFGRGGEDTKMVTDFLNLCNLECVPFESTYHTSTCDSILDVICSNCTDNLISFGQTPAAGFSAHDLIYAVFNFSVPRCSNQTFSYRNFKSIQSDILLSEVEAAPWYQVYEKGDIDSKLDVFNNIILDLMNKHAPYQTKVAVKTTAPWMTTEIRKQLKERDSLRRKCNRTKNKTDFDNFRLLRNKVKQAIRNAKINYYYQKFNCKNTKQIWSVVRTLNPQGSNNLPAPVIPVNDLNIHYASVASVKNATLTSQCVEKYANSPPHKSTVSDTFHFKYVLPGDIFWAVNSVKSKATGFDNIPITFLRLCLPALMPVLDHLFNYSLQNSVFPSMWKLANIVPIPKIKEPKESKDYRPVSILCVLGKILEKMVHRQVSEFLLNNSLFATNQSGFRPKHSTVTALVKRYITALNSSPLPPLMIKDCVIPYANSVNNLGVHFDSTLSWNEQCLVLSRKVLGTLAQLKRNLSFIPPNVRKLLISALIMPHLEYASVLFTDISDTNHTKLQRLQNACVRFITGVSRFAHISPFYQQLNLLTLHSRRIIAIATLTIKIIKYQSPKYLYHNFKFISTHSSRSTRSHSLMLSVPIHRTEKFHNSFLVQASKIWNDLKLYNYLNKSDAAAHYNVVKLRVQTDLEDVTKYCVSHNLMMNVAKTKVIIFGTQRYLTQLNETYIAPFTVGDCVIPYSNSVNNLGVIFDSTLSWNDHCILVAQKVFSTLAQLKRNFSYIPPNIRKILISSLVFPHIDYASVIFTDMSAGNNIKLQKLQNACIRFITGASLFDHVTPYYRELGFLKVEERRNLSVAMLMWRIMKCQEPKYLYESYVFTSSSNSRSTRSSKSMIQLPNHRLQKYHNSFHIQSIKCWNTYRLYDFINKSPTTVRNHVFNILFDALAAI